MSPQPQPVFTNVLCVGEMDSESTSVSGVSSLGLALSSSLSDFRTRESKAHWDDSLYWPGGSQAFPPARKRKALIVLDCFPECLSQTQQKETWLSGFQPSRTLGTSSAQNAQVWLSPSLQSTGLQLFLSGFQIKWLPPAVNSPG